VSIGAIQWNIKCQKWRLLYYFIKCQMGRLLYYFIKVSNGAIQWILKCQMGWFNGLLSVKWGDYYKCQMGRFIIICQMERLKLLCQFGRYPDHGLFAFHASASTLSLESCVCSYSIFQSMNILNKMNKCFSTIPWWWLYILIWFDVIIYYWFYFMGVED